MKVSYNQLESSVSHGNVFLAGMPILSIAQIGDVFEDILWFQLVWCVNGVPYCKAFNKSRCVLTLSTAGNYSVSIAATVLVNVTAGAESTLVKKKSQVVEHLLLVKGKQSDYWNLKVKTNSLLEITYNVFLCISC